MFSDIDRLPRSDHYRQVNVPISPRSLGFSHRAKMAWLPWSHTSDWTASSPAKSPGLKSWHPWPCSINTAPGRTPSDSSDHTLRLEWWPMAAFTHMCNVVHNYVLWGNHQSRPCGLVLSPGSAAGPLPRQPRPHWTCPRYDLPSP